MGRKIVSMFTLVAFMVLSVSCVHYRYTELKDKPATQWEGEKVKIVEVLKKSGEIIEFSKKNPAYVQKDKIVGSDITGTRLSIPLSEVKEVRIKKYDYLASVLTVILSVSAVIFGFIIWIVASILDS